MKDNRGLRFVTWVAGLTVFFGWSTFATATFIFDYSPLTTGGSGTSFANLSAGQNLVERIFFSTDVQVTDMDIYSQALSGSVGDSVTIRIFNDAGGQPGSLFTTFNETISIIDTEGTISVDNNRKHTDFSTPVNLLANTDYWIGMSSNEILDIGQLGLSVSSPEDSRMFQLDGPTPDFLTPDFVGDMAFRLSGQGQNPIPEPCTILDHFLSYKIRKTKGTPKFEKQEVTLTDQFESDVLFEVKKPKEIYNPADKNGEEIIDPDTHLVAFEIKRAKTEPRQPKHVKRTNIEVVNQFGTIFVDTKKPDRLLVPSLKDLDIPIPDIDVPDEFPVDHFKCYKVKVSEGTPEFESIQVTLADHFEDKLFDVKKPKRLCNPVDKNGEGIINPDAHLLCYKVKPAEDEPKHIKVEGIHTNNLFGPLQFDTKKEAELCVPSTRQFNP